MSKVEVSENQGVPVLESLSGVRQPEYSAPRNLSDYTKHGYQVVTTSIQAGTDVAFIVYATNDEEQNWFIVARYNIRGSGHLVTGAVNKSGILYYDTWNYKYVRCALLGAFTGGENFKVLEKHNA